MLSLTLIFSMAAMLSFPRMWHTPAAEHVTAFSATFTSLAATPLCSTIIREVLVKNHLLGGCIIFIKSNQRLANLKALCGCVAVCAASPPVIPLATYNPSPVCTEGTAPAYVGTQCGVTCNPSPYNTTGISTNVTVTCGFYSGTDSDHWHAFGVCGKCACSLW